MEGVLNVFDTDEELDLTNDDILLVNAGHRHTIGRANRQ
jgi:mannose-6-phosphate isomerase-like protein (cupin superfamily)